MQNYTKNAKQLNNTQKLWRTQKSIFTITFRKSYEISFYNEIYTIQINQLLSISEFSVGINFRKIICQIEFVLLSAQQLQRNIAIERGPLRLC